MIYLVLITVVVLFVILGIRAATRTQSPDRSQKPPRRDWAASGVADGSNDSQSDSGRSDSGSTCSDSGGSSDSGGGGCD